MLRDVHGGAGVIEGGLSFGEAEGKLQAPLAQILLTLSVTGTTRENTRQPLIFTVSHYSLISCFKQPVEGLQHSPYSFLICNDKFRSPSFVDHLGIGLHPHPAARFAEEPEHSQPSLSCFKH